LSNSERGLLIEELILSLFLRSLVIALIVVSATLVAERVNPFYASLIGAFPTSAGPAYVMLALKEDAAFLAESAISSMSAMAAVAPFMTVIIWVAPRTNIFYTIICGLSVWSLFAIPISQLVWGPFSAFVLNLFIFSTCFWLTRKLHVTVIVPIEQVVSWNELMLRVFFVGCFVATLVTASNLLGPLGVGIGAVFPIVFLSLVIVLYLRQGGALVAATMYNALRTVSGMVIVFLVLGYSVQFWGSAIGLTAAFLMSVLWVLIMVTYHRWASRPASNM
jgi:uncharacterized membrane protein (GlpM family)